MQELLISKFITCFSKKKWWFFLYFEPALTAIGFDFCLKIDDLWRQQWILIFTWIKKSVTFNETLILMQKSGASLFWHNNLKKYLDICFNEKQLQMFFYALRSVSSKAIENENYFVYCWHTKVQFCNYINNIHNSSQE